MYHRKAIAPIVAVALCLTAVQTPNAFARDQKSFKQNKAPTGTGSTDDSDDAETTTEAVVPPTSSAPDLVLPSPNAAMSKMSVAEILELARMAPTTDIESRLLKTGAALAKNVDEIVSLARATKSPVLNDAIVHRGEHLATTFQDIIKLAKQTTSGVEETRILKTALRCTKTMDDVMRVASAASVTETRDWLLVNGKDRAKNIADTVVLSQLASAAAGDSILEWGAANRTTTITVLLSLVEKCRGDDSKDRILDVGCRYATCLADLLTLSRSTHTAEARDRLLLKGVALAQKASEVERLQNESSSLVTRRAIFEEYLRRSGVKLLAE